MRADWILIVLVCLLTGCQTVRPVRAVVGAMPVANPDFAQHRATIATVRASVQDAGEKTATASRTVETAQATAGELLRLAPPDLRPTVERLTVELEGARLQLDGLKAVLELSQADAIRAETENAVLEAQVAANAAQARDTLQAYANAQGSLDDANKALTKAETQRDAKGKWLWIAWGVAGVEAVLCLFLFRAKLPFV